ncbi:MAG: hypothetical protein HOM68_12430 [Gemmatimonadetes bacterium]|jgi:hypothetical protein|nr:hypothetical protein [Gemmatimonadota bacterium]MBT5057340.1 hypothetical protein [Gemmatimonadota bacterium]MBT5145910.1 hypothetical protein [Gemmatimonadota bacterium]MBT5589954.1 hypothetical protein [Gemmatimonadota bacterium]MBT5963376.1 hypothetical protein [Gemmatimonadota bacterium]
MQILLSHLARAWLRLLIMVLAVLLLTLPSITTAGRNVILDAVTRATTWNTYTGDLELLQDGEVPGEGVQPRALLWEGGGILVFEWDEPLALEKVRIYIGEIGNNYIVRAYLGGRLDEIGVIRVPEGLQTADVPDDSRKVSQWTQVSFPAGTMADNIEIVALGTIVFYEIEVHVLDPVATVIDPASNDPTSIKTASWSRVKGMPRQLAP